MLLSYRHRRRHDTLLLRAILSNSSATISPSPSPLNKSSNTSIQSSLPPTQNSQCPYPSEMSSSTRPKPSPSLPYPQDGSKISSGLILNSTTRRIPSKLWSLESSSRRSISRRMISRPLGRIIRYTLVGFRYRSMIKWSRRFARPLENWSFSTWSEKEVSPKDIVSWSMRSMHAGRRQWKASTAWPSAIKS